MNGVVGMERCNRKESKHWLLEGPNSEGYYRLSDDNEDSAKKQCVTRYKAGGKRNEKGAKARLRNSISTQPCEKDTKSSVTAETGYVQLEIVETAVHDAGFYLRTVDGLCFDGSKFRKCEPVGELLWGVGLSFSGNGEKGDVERSFFKFHLGNRCLEEDVNHVNGGYVGMGSCENNKHARRWGLKRGKLSRNNSQICVVRTLDNGAATRMCSEGWFEHLTAEIPLEAEKARAQSEEYYRRDLSSMISK
mmetsp:Transcript_16352/g.23981  ORF Transcript_16352/g.23981 Transcript_16352/m.23981 type:complete len:248 (+) Transcript_16352:145-888(+)|eukprot:CAMPEP_0195540910 /NCGR_PEP_ID=MMETSP0794_2-20130614/50809_1 /TAXON_ID=515487 /ORGANISM="Stephanopyxis turris, Strain CCMP 815" /LENGTH=247 /DNA_ID=CAMNT_0040674987 /DNA_START=489 /DNA_END=1232 /DNA_ORIENTATION=-